MKCRRVKRLLSRYIDKELIDAKTIKLIEDHLGLCSNCKANFESFISLKNLFIDKDRINLFDDFLERIKEKARHKTSNIMRPSWTHDAGDLAKRLIPVPVVISVLVMFLLFGANGKSSPVEDYIFADLTLEEMAIAGGYYNPLAFY